MTTRHARRLRRHAVPLAMGIASVACYAFGVHVPRTSACVEAGMVAYQFCHVSIWHLLGNLSALLSIERSGLRTEWWSWLLAYAISALFPCSATTEGMSGLLYAMLGQLSWQATEKRKYHAWCGVFMAVCFLMPHSINGWLHVWCYGLGVASAMPHRVRRGIKGGDDNATYSIQ